MSQIFEDPKLTDQYGNIIEDGDEVISVQPSGGILSPAPPTRGVVTKRPGNYPPYKYEYLLRYVRADGSTGYIWLEGKINTINIL